MGFHEDSFTTTSGRQIIWCNNCGTRYSMYPLTSEYISIMPDPCPRGDYQKSFFDCINCNQRNTFIGIKDTEKTETWLQRRK